MTVRGASGLWAAPSDGSAARGGAGRCRARERADGGGGCGGDCGGGGAGSLGRGDRGC